MAKDGRTVWDRQRLDAEGEGAQRNARSLSDTAQFDERIERYRASGLLPA